MEPPSKHLVSTLSELGLCSARDLRRCRGRVRRLARDLPAFDSVWIDALVQARRLTPYQAQLLESGHAEALKVGPCVIVERLGTGVSAETFLAEVTARHERCVLKRIQVPSEQLDAATEGLHGLVQRLSNVSHASIAGPFTVQRQQDQLFVLSNHIAGPHLGELLIRRGRFDPQVVSAIARQLLDGLCQLERADCVHGDILLSNVRCQTSGRMVLVDTGIKPVVKPHISYYDDSPPERFDGLAPELVGPGRRPDVRSDLYALGCLLWQLLAARPPFIHADPLLKLAAHQSQTIDDVRTWVPDAPDSLAEGIRRLTSRDPNGRPRTFREARELFGPPTHRDAARLRGFRSMFQSRAVPLRGRSSSRPGRLAWTAAALLLVSGLVTTMFHAGLRTELLSLTNRFTSASVETPAVAAVDADVPAAKTAPHNQSSRWLPLPLPDAKGTISLDSPGPYVAGKINHVGRLTISAPEQQSAVIVVDAEPLMIACEKLHLENVELKFADPKASATALLLVHAQEFTASGCRFAGEATGTMPNASIGWKRVDAGNPQGGRFEVSHAVFTGECPSIYLADVPQHLTLDNVLKVGGGPLVKLKQMPDAGSTLAVQLRNVTCRRSGPVFCASLLRGVDSESAALRHGQIQCIAENCVFDFSEVDGRFAPLIELSDPETPPNWFENFSLVGEGNLVNPNVTLAGLHSPLDHSHRVLDDSQMSVEGLMIESIQFVGPDDGLPENSRINPPRIASTSSLPPGLDLQRLPEWLRGGTGE